MSINNTEQYQAASSRIFNDYSVSEGSSNSLKEEQKKNIMTLAITLLTLGVNHIRFH
jgi:hypothetical protein